MELANGLLARGFEAYWVKANQPEHGVFYRVRVGRFQNLDMARSYAEDLLDSGLLDTCSVTVYEAPTNSLFKTSAPAQPGIVAGISDTPLAASCPVKLADGQLNDSDDLIASIGKNRWLLSSNKSVVYLLPNKKSASLVADVVFLMRAIDKNRWRLRSDLNFVTAPAVSSKQTTTAPLVVPQMRIGPLLSNIAASLVPTTTAPLVMPEMRIGPSLSNIATSLVPRNTVTTAVRPVVDTNNSENLQTFNAAPSAPVNSGRLTVAEPGITKINRTGSAPPSRNLSFLPPPRLQGTIEMRDGQLMMKIKNTDLQRSFNGVARITVSDDKNSNDVSPMSFELRPNEEKVVPVNESTMAYGDWMMMVYDEKQVVQLVRSAPFGQRPAPLVPESQTAAQPAQPSQAEPGPWKLSEPAEGGPPPNSLPNVTGVFDATVDGKPVQPDSGTPSKNIGTGPQQLERQVETSSPPIQPGQVAVIPRQVAVTAENVTIELDISASQPLGYVRVSLRAGSYQDDRYALLSTRNGRIPFLIPAAQAKGEFGFEVRNDTGNVLGGGAGDFRQLGR